MLQPVLEVVMVIIKKINVLDVTINVLDVQDLIQINVKLVEMVGI